MVLRAAVLLKEEGQFHPPLFRSPAPDLAGQHVTDSVGRNDFSIFSNGVNDDGVEALVHVRGDELQE